jgi:hypothetical protein
MHRRQRTQNQSRRHHREELVTLADDIRHYRRQLTDAQDALAACHRLITPALIACDQATGDGWRTRGEGGHPGTHSDPVGATIEAITDILELRSQMRLQATTVFAGANTLRNTLARLGQIGARTAPGSTQRPATCTAAIGMPGYESWGRTDRQGAPTRCDDLIHADGLCASCWAARRRWTNATRDGRTYTRQPIRNQGSDNPGIRTEPAEVVYIPR